MLAYPSTMRRSPKPIAGSLSRMAAVAVLLATTAPVAAQQDPYTEVYLSVTCDPDGTATVDVFVVGGDVFCYHTPILTSAEFAGSEIRIRFDIPPSGLCFDAWADWSGSAQIEDVPAGLYPVVVNLYNSSGNLYDSIVDGPVNTHCCPADLAEPFGVLNFFDIALFLSLFQTQDWTTDWNGDGVFNFFDMAAYLNAFNGGCP